MKVFGPVLWGAWSERTLVETPVGALCLYCREAISSGQLGVLMPYSGEEGDTEKPAHRECVLYVTCGRPPDVRGTLRESALETARRIEEDCARCGSSGIDPDSIVEALACYDCGGSGSAEDARRNDSERDRGC